MPVIPTLNAPNYTAGQPILSAQVKADFASIKDTVNTFAVLTDVARTISAIQTFSATPVFNAGVTVTGNSTVAGTLGSITTLSCATLNASGVVTAGTGLTVTTGNLTLSAGQAIAKRVDDGDSGTAKTLDFATGNIHRVRLTGNCTFTFSNPATGATYFVELLQDATGSRTVTWPATVKWGGGGTAPTLTTTASRKDCFCFFFNGTNYMGSPYDFNFVDTV